MNGITHLVAVLYARLRRPKIRDKDLESLWNALSSVDFASEDPAKDGWVYKRLEGKGKLKIKMYQEPGHSRPHFHVDYGPDNHVAVYAVDTGERIAGNLDQRFDKAVSAWAIANKPTLLAIWCALQSGKPESTFVKSLSTL